MKKYNITKIATISLIILIFTVSLSAITFSSNNITTGSFISVCHGEPADIDGDGNIDIIAGSMFLDVIRWWKNNSDGSFTFTYNIDASYTDPQVVRCADLDNDGDMDVVAASSQSADDVDWWENDGTPLDGGWVQHNIILDFNEPYSL